MKSLAKSFIAPFALLLLNSAAQACPWCRAAVKGDVYDGNFLINLFFLLLPIMIIATIGFILYYLDRIRDKFRGEIK